MLSNREAKEQRETVSSAIMGLLGLMGSARTSLWLAEPKLTVVTSPLPLCMVVVISCVNSFRVVVVGMEK